MPTLILNSKGFPESEDFTVEYNVPLRFKRIALQSFSMWVSWYNISSDVMRYFDGNSWIDLEFPDGNYTLRELNNFLAAYFRADDPPIKFGVVFARQRFVLKLAENYKVDFSHGKLRDILGFESSVYDQPEQEARFVANISKGIDNIHIHCDIIEGCMLNQNSSEVIYSFTPSNPPGSQISKEFEKLSFFRVKTDPIYKIRMHITNQDNVPINLNGQQVIYRLLTE